MVVTKFPTRISTLAVGALLALPAAAFSAEPTKQVTFSKDVAPILQAKCQSCHEPGSIAPMSLRTYQEARPWAQVDQGRASPAVRCRRGTSTAASAFRNSRTTCRSPTSRSTRSSPGSIRARSKAIRPTCRRSSRSTTKLYWQAERDGYGPPDLIVKSPEYTMPAVSQDQWWRPTVDIPELTEPRWVRMVEIRPTNIQGRKILHHSIAHLVMIEAIPTARQSRASRAAAPPAGRRSATSINARPNLMEWAIGKGYDRYPDGTGKLIKPGETISWDQHVHAVGEEVTAGSRARHLALSERPGAEAPHLSPGFTGLKNGTVGLDIPPNSIAHTEGFTVLKENTVITNFQPHFHLRGKAMQVEAILPDGSHADRQLRRQLQLQLDDELHLRRRRGAGVPEGHDHPRHRVLRQHRRRTRTTPIRISGSATAIAPWTRWRTRG